MSTSIARDPAGYLRRTLSMYRELLFDPETFYDNLGAHRIRVEVLLVLAIGIVGSIAGFYSMSTLSSIVGLEGDSSTAFQLWRLAATPLIEILLLWVGGTTVFFVLSWIYTNSGSYFHLLKNVAWSLFPFLFVNLLQGIGMVAVTAGMPDEPAWLAEFDDIRLPTEEANFLWDQISSDPIVMALTLVGFVFVAWSGYIASFAVADVRDLTRNESYLVVAGPVVLYIVYEAAHLFGVL